MNSAVKDSLIAVTAEDPEGFQGGGGVRPKFAPIPPQSTKYPLDPPLCGTNISQNTQIEIKKIYYIMYNNFVMQHYTFVQYYTGTPVNFSIYYGLKKYIHHCIYRCPSKLFFFFLL